MAYDVRRLKLRKLELQIRYHAAYQFWNLKGVIAEKWGHGPHFGAYSETPTEVRLTEKAGESSPLVGRYGLKLSAFTAENLKVDVASELASEWLKDCLTTLRPLLVNRLILRMFYAYPAPDAENVSRALGAEYPGVEKLLDPNSYEATHGGLQAQQISGAGTDMQTTASIVFGVYGPHQEAEWFNVVRADDEPWNLGFHYFRDQLSSSPTGFEDVTTQIDQIIEAGTAEAWKWARTHVAKVINRSERDRTR